MENILYCILLCVLIVWVLCLAVLKTLELMDECDRRKRSMEYFDNLSDFLQLTDTIRRLDTGLDGMSERMTQFETDFKTYDGLLENRLTDIETAVKEWQEKPERAEKGVIA